MWGWLRKWRTARTLKRQVLEREFEDIEARVRYVLSHREQAHVLPYDPVQGMSYRIVLHTPRVGVLCEQLEVLLDLAKTRGEISSDWKRKPRQQQTVLLDDVLVNAAGKALREPEACATLEAFLTEIDLAFAACYKVQDESHVQYLLRFYTSVLYDSCEILTALYRCRKLG